MGCDRQSFNVVGTPILIPCAVAERGKPRRQAVGILDFASGASEITLAKAANP
jgi:hypothetical protein